MGVDDRYIVAKPLTDPWNQHVAVGTVVYRYHGYTYGVIAPGGVAVSLKPGETPFFEVPASSLSPEPVPDRMSIVPVSEVTPQEAVDAMVKWCGRNWEPDMVCPMCGGLSPDCSEPIDVDGCEHGWDCPWLLVLAVAE